MGLGIWPYRHESASTINSGNPNPSNFKIEKFEQVGKYTIMEVVYPDATNFEGKKILVFENLDMVALINSKRLDPHFQVESNLIARFKPDEKGWERAHHFAFNYGL